MLPAPADLERICKGIAALDAMLCADWELRHYAFNASWDETGTERMASMQNGSGDEWFLVLGSSGAFLKAFWHEHPRADRDAVYAGLPAPLRAHLTEAAFAMDDVTFGGFHDGTSWTLRGDEGPMAEDLAILSGSAEAYRAYAEGHFEVELPLDGIEHVLAGKPLDAALLYRLGSERTMRDLETDLAEIAYGI